MVGEESHMDMVVMDILEPMGKEVIGVKQVMEVMEVMASGMEVMATVMVVMAMVVMAMVMVVMDMVDGMDVATVMEDMAATDMVTTLGVIILQWECIIWVKRIGETCTSLLNQLIQFTNTWTQSQSPCKIGLKELAIFLEKLSFH
jgi:hypothetical protein